MKTESAKRGLGLYIGATLLVWLLVSQLWWGVRHPHCSDIARLAHFGDVLLFRDTPECK